MEPVKYQYSKINSVLYFAVFSLILVLTVPSLINFIYNHDFFNGAPLLCIDLVLLVSTIYLIVQRLIPALQGKTALELTEEGIVSYIRNFTLDWSYIQDIELRGFRSAYLYITFNCETDYGDHVAITLKWVAGNDTDIYETVVAYFNSLAQ